MRAIVLEKFGGLDSLVYKEIPEPEPKAGHVVIEIKAFGINHAEMHMRRGEWAETADSQRHRVRRPGEVLPRRRVPGRGQGGGADGRPRPHDQRQLRRIHPRARHRTSRSSSRTCSWAELAAIPETYATAWTCLFRNLEIAKGQTLVIRGATSSFGQAALNMAVNAGARGHRDHPQPRAVRHAGGAGRRSASRWRGRTFPSGSPRPSKLDAVLDLVGNSTILDSLAMLRRGGRACLAGWLGGLAPIADFNPLLQMASGVYLTFFGSFVFGTPGFPLSDVPLQEIARRGGGRPPQGEAVARVPLRGDPRGTSRHGGQRGRRQDGGGSRLIDYRHGGRGVGIAPPRPSRAKSMAGEPACVSCAHPI